MNDFSQKIGFLFDLDGVLIDSENEYSKIWIQLNKEFPTGVENLELKIKGCTLTKILNDYYPDDNTKSLVAKRLHELEDQMQYDYLPYAKEFLKELKKRGISCALVTSSDNRKISHLKEELPDILNFFDFIVTGDLVKTSKPSPEGYLLAASKLNLKPQKCVVFEDSEQGVLAGKNANSYVVGITGTIDKDKLEPHVNEMINNFNELDIDELILKLQNR